jgi:hypothetical protein
MESTPKIKFIIDSQGRSVFTNEPSKYFEAPQANNQSNKFLNTD